MAVGDRSVIFPIESSRQRLLAWCRHEKRAMRIDISMPAGSRILPARLNCDQTMDSWHAGSGSGLKNFRDPTTRIGSKWSS